MVGKLVSFWLGRKQNLHVYHHITKRAAIVKRTDNSFFHTYFCFDCDEVVTAEAC